jgi:dTDP-4-amino-4,6-dideoxygalactose transaminase
MDIQFVDLKRQYKQIEKEISTAIKEVLEATAFVAGPYVKQFEDNFAAAHHAQHCIGLNSGTSALHTALMALNIGHGDEVIIPTNTFFATAEAVAIAGAVPVFVDCDQNYYNIDPKSIEEVITKKTKAIIPVHLYGQPAPMAEIIEISKRYNLIVIEDCAQAHLALHDGRPVGTFGHIGCFSFYPGKNLGAYGEGGAVITNNSELYHKMLALRDHGSKQKYHHEFIGHNYRMEGIQGAILNVKLSYLNEWTDLRRSHAKLYNELLTEIKPIIVPQESDNVKHVYHLYVVRAKNRNQLMEYLKEHGINTGIHYPIPCHKQIAFKKYPCKRNPDLKNSEQFCDNLLSLPMFPELTEKEIVYIASKIKGFYYD